MNKREDYTRAYAKAFLASECGSDGRRRQDAFLQSSPERIAAETAEQMVKGLKRQIETVRLRIEVERSRSALLRSEMVL